MAVFFGLSLLQDVVDGRVVAIDLQRLAEKHHLDLLLVRRTPAKLRGYHDHRCRGERLLPWIKKGVNKDVLANKRNCENFAWSGHSASPQSARVPSHMVPVQCTSPQDLLTVTIKFLLLHSTISIPQLLPLQPQTPPVQNDVSYMFFIFLKRLTSSSDSYSHVLDS